jgi:hypothetical protein
MFTFDPHKNVAEPISYRGSDCHPTSAAPPYTNNFKDSPVCGAHVTLANGDVFWVGGQNGQEVVQFFSPSDSVLACSMAARSPIGAMYYNTAVLIRNDLVFVFPNLYQPAPYWGDLGAEPHRYNNAAALYNVSVDRNGGNPWTIFWRDSEALENHGTVLQTIGYTSIWCLKHIVTVNNVPYDLLGVGDAQRILLINSHNSSQTYLPPNGLRPDLNNQAPMCNFIDWGYFSAIMLESGEIALAGGCLKSPASSKAHIYHPVRDSWRTIELGISRAFGTFVLLPDSTVMLFSGWNPLVSSGSDSDNSIRIPQLINFTSGQVTNFTADDRGRIYHNWAILMEDARVLVGGGLSNMVPTYFAVGCESPNARYFSPSYLTKNSSRPRFISTPDSIDINLPFSLNYSGTSVQRVVAMTLPAFTHQWDSNMRLVVLKIIDKTPHTMTVRFPADSEIVLHTVYTLFLISIDQVPSIGVTIPLSTSSQPYSTLVDPTPVLICPGDVDPLTKFSQSNGSVACGTAAALLPDVFQSICLDLNGLFDQLQQSNPTGQYIPSSGVVTLGHFLRLAYHDSAEYDARVANSGPNGCVDLNQRPNQSLKPTIDLLEPVLSRYCQVISRADLWNLAAIMAVRRASTGAVKIPFYYGRTDKTLCLTKRNMFPSPDGGFEEITKTMVQQLGLSTRSAIALLGGHCLKGSSVFSNHFFKSLLQTRWIKRSNLQTAESSVQWSNLSGTSVSAMFSTDLALLFKHPEIFPLSKKCGYSVDNCSINDQQVNDSSNHGGASS